MTSIDLLSVIEDAGYNRSDIAGKARILLVGGDAAMVSFLHADGTSRSFTVSITTRGEILVHAPLNRAAAGGTLSAEVVNILNEPHDCWVPMTLASGEVIAIPKFPAAIDGSTPGWGEEVDPCYLGGELCQGVHSDPDHPCSDGCPFGPRC